jgi:hypothetical protein
MAPKGMTPKGAAGQIEPHGEVPEWSNGAVSKTVERAAFRGFESLSLRQAHSKIIIKTIY